jgi:CheY-like chemotaxis protein/anti-sigma regulatory factor (Ser/Thr protein kinase)
MNSIIGFAELLTRRDDVQGDVRHQIDLIRRSGSALLTVVNDILDVSKIEAGRVELDPKPVQLAQLAQDLIAIVAPGAAQKGLTLTGAFDGDPGQAHIVDDHRLGQVLLNLLNNAVKFTDAGEVRLQITVESSEDDGRDHVRFAITDSGVGIAPENQARLFRRFVQVDSSVSRAYGGTGLGLAICKGLVDLMGGTIGVESQAGQGSTFQVMLPLDRAALAHDVASEAVADGMLGAHILLVDDHPVNRELGLVMLTMLGCTCETAANGVEALEAAQSGRYDLIFMDLHMPVLDGLGAARAIAALPGPAGAVPIVALTADVMPEKQAECRAAGLVDAIGKPIDIEHLRAAISQWRGVRIDREAAA